MSNAPDHDILSLMPSDTPRYMSPVWIGCIHWALGEPDVIARFRAETGNQRQPGRTARDRAIDKACDSEWRFVKAFIIWANENVWGPIDGGKTDA